jgi:hypothetical protein
MSDATELKLRHVTDKKGTKKEVSLPIKDFKNQLEDLADLAIAAER